MEADWLRTYRRDLREDVFGERPLGLRRLRALVLGLPADAMIWRRVPGWGVDQELAAVSAEIAHSSMRVQLSAYSKKGASIPKALRIPRPTDTDRRRPRTRRATPADLARFGGSVVRLGSNGGES